MSIEGSGATVGVARGRIVIDTSDLAAARALVMRSAGEMGRAFQGMGRDIETTSRSSVSAIQQIDNALAGMIRRSALFLSGMVAGGVASAQKMEQLNKTFTILVGSQQKANEQMAVLQGLADRTQQPFGKVLEAAVGLLPALKQSNAELDKTVSVAQRLSILDPAQGVEGAAYAVREFLNGEYLSLVRRFELDRSRLMQIRNDSGGDAALAIEGLNQYLTELGYTEDAIAGMADTGRGTFALLRDEAQLTLAQGFQPMNAVLTDMQRGLADFFKEAREGYPDLVKIAAVMATIGAVGAVGSRGIPLLGIGGVAGFGIAAAVGASAYGGLELGNAGARWLAQQGVGNDERLATASRDETFAILKERFGQIIGLFIAGIGAAAKTVVDLSGIVALGGVTIGNAASKLAEALQILYEIFVNAGDKLAGAIEYLVLSLREGIAGLFEGIADKLDLPVVGDKFAKPFEEAAEAIGVGSDRLQQAHDRMNQPLVPPDARERLAGGIAPSEEQVARIATNAADMRASIDAFTVDFLEWVNIIDTGDEVVAQQLAAIRTLFDNSIEVLRTNQGPKGGFSEDQVTAFADFQKRLKQIEADAQVDREAQLLAHEEAKADIEARYQKTLSRLAEDEAIARERRIADLQSRIADIREGADSSVATAFAQHLATLAQLREEYQQAEADAAQAHKDKMEDLAQSLKRAAARLDSGAVLDIRQQMVKEVTRDSRDTQERRQQFQERLAEEQQEHEERIALARESADTRIQDLIDEYNKAEELRQKDSDLRLARMQEDHEEQLVAQDTANQRRLEQINRQAEEQKAAEEANYRELFNSLEAESGNHQNRMILIQRTGQEQAEKELQAWWQRQAAIFNGGAALQQVGQAGQNIVNTLSDFFPRFASGGVMPHTGLAILEAGERVLTPAETNMIQRMMGSDNIPSGGIAAALAGGYGTRAGGGGRPSVTIGDINFYDVGSHSIPELREMVVSTMADVMEAYVN